MENEENFASTNLDKNKIISPALSKSVALQVLNDHNRKIRSTKKTKICLPGRPHLQKNSERQNDRDEIRVQKFYVLLKKSPTIPELCKMSWPGIPSKIRPFIWRLLCGYMPMNAERRQSVLNRKRKIYWSLVRMYYTADKDKAFKNIYHQIHIDVPRMNPNIELLQEKFVQEAFERILFVWAIMHPASSYVQGINDLVTPFYVVFLQEIPNEEKTPNFSVKNLSKCQRDDVEADTFWCLSKLLDGIQDNYVFCDIKVPTKIKEMEAIVKRVDEKVHLHLVNNGVSYIQFAFRWMNNLLTRELPLGCIVRLWDTLLSENESLPSFLPCICAAFLLYWSKVVLLKKEFQDIILFLQNLPTQDWTDHHVDVLVAEAYKLKVIFYEAQVLGGVV